MNYFRKFLIYLRQQKNTNFNKFVVITSLALAISIIIGVLADLYLPWNYFINTVRCIFLLVTGTTAFSLFYTFIPDNDTEIKFFRLRKILSFRQRLNLSLLIWFIVIILDLILVKPGTASYTISGSIICAISLGLFTFIRPTYEETKRFENNVIDERDFKEVKTKEKE